MRKSSLLTAALALGGLAFGANAQVVSPQPFEQCDESAAHAGPLMSMPASTVVGAKSDDQMFEDMLDLHGWLASEASTALAKAAGLSAALSRQDKFSLGLIDCAECELMQEQERRYLVGLAQQVDHVVDFGRGGSKRLRSGEFGKGALRTLPDGGFSWTIKLASEGAAGLRIALSGLDLPADAALYVFNDRGEAFGPYLGKGINQSGTVTTNMVSGDVAYLQLRVFGPAVALDQLSFRIDSIGHISSRFELAKQLDAAAAAGTKAHCTSGIANATCVENAECYTTSRYAPINDVRKAIASMLYASGSGYYICTGGLIANASNSPMFLTANHCLSKAAEANSLELYWNHTVSCGTRNCSYAWTLNGRTSDIGASILATSTTGDFTLLSVNSQLPSGAVRLAWTNQAVANTANVQLYRISHPKGAPQAYSEQRVNTTAGTCRTLPRGTYIYSTDNLGATEGGSSGSPVLNAGGEIVGQLYGACGTNVNDVCDFNSNRTVDGALAAYFSQVESHLTGGGGGGTDPTPPDPTDPGTYTLTAQGSKVQGRWRTDLAWSGAGSSTVDVYRNNAVVATVTGTSYTDATNLRGGGSLTYKVCDAGTSNCSNQVTVNF
jgi:V8-like Glu-specific endopeptidase